MKPLTHSIATVVTALAALALPALAAAPSPPRTDGIRRASVPTADLRDAA